MLQERCRPLAQSGVIKSPRVQLENGLLRTKQKPTSLPTLHDNTSSRGPQKSFIPGGSVQPENNLKKSAFLAGNHPGDAGQRRGAVMEAVVSLPADGGLTAAA